jgi:hypothetical protein
MLEAAPAPQYACDPALTRLFTPPRPLMGRYEVCTTDEHLETVVAAPPFMAAFHPAIEALEALDAFGAAGTYRRAALSRLYGGTRVQVARGWSSSAGGFESVTLLSPYPDASLTRLLPGTLEIRWTLKR